MSRPEAQLTHSPRYDKLGPGNRLGGDTLQRQTEERWKQLCERVVLEQDPKKFEAAILELLEVLESGDHRQRNAGIRVPPIEKPGGLSCPLG